MVLASNILLKFASVKLPLRSWNAPTITMTVGAEQEAGGVGEEQERGGERAQLLAVLGHRRGEEKRE